MASKSEPSEGEIWATRFNVGLARSQRVISSWLAQSMKATTTEESDDENLRAADERAPIGAKPKDDNLPESVRRSRASNDKLLEQIIGKKAAQAKRKEASKPKPVAKPIPAPVAEDSDDEDEGRAAAFSSRKKTRDPKVPAYAVSLGKAEKKLDPHAEPPDPREDLATVKEMTKGDSEAEDRVPKKRKAGSYLDEVLAKKAKKSKKNKKAVTA